MRIFIALAVAAVIIGAIGLGMKTIFTPVDSTGSITKAMATSKTVSPHEMHLNYQNMKELPVREVKEPF